MTSTTYAFHTLWGPLDGRIHEPETTPAAGVVVVTGSWLTVKEQMPLRYAEALTERGFTAVTFDFPGFGGSAGALRQAELPGQKVAVIAEIARQVAELGVVPGRKVGHLAVCASAQYALTALAEGAPISALVSVAGWFHDPATVADLYGGPDGVRERLERGRQAAARYLADGTVNTVPAYREGDENAAMFIELDYYADTARGAIPAWNNEMAELSWEPWLRFDGLSPAAADIDTPVLFVHSDDSVLPDNARHLAESIPGATLLWTDGFQTDFYDLDPQVGVAADAAADHFRTHLVESSQVTAPDTLVRLVHAVDRLDWDRVRSCLADTIALDYSELFGEPARATPRDQLVTQWRALLPGFASTQHLLGPLTTDPDDNGLTHANVRAWHYLGDSDPWVVAGHYEVRHDEANRIIALTLRVYHVNGPDDAPQHATERAAREPRH